MPLFLLPFLVGGGLGLGGGFFASSGAKTLRDIAIVSSVGFGAFLIARKNGLI